MSAVPELMLLPHSTFASPLLVCRIAGFQSTPTFSLFLVQHPSATSRRSEEAPTLRGTARSDALQAPVRPCNYRQLAATWHQASGTLASHRSERGALTLTVRVHYVLVSKMHKHGLIRNAYQALLT